MSSILNNSAALSALQALQMTQQSLNTVQNQVSTGLAVANASDNSSYWSIAQQLDSDSGVVTASQSALSESQSVLSTATSAIDSVITTLNAMATQLTQAQNPGAVLTDINTSLASLGQQLTDAVNGASFNGLNVLNGSQTAMNFVSGFNASATGGAVNTVNFTAQSLTGGAPATSGTTTTSTVSNATSAGAAALAALEATLPTAPTSYAPATVGAPQVYQGKNAGGDDTMTVNTVDSAGNTTSTTYTAAGGGQTGSLAADIATGGIVTGLTVSTTYTPAAVARSQTTTSNITSSTMMASLLATGTAGNVAPAPTAGADQVMVNTAGTASMIVNSLNPDGSITSTTYTGLNAAGNAVTGVVFDTADAASFKSIEAVTTVIPKTVNAALTTTSSTLTNTTQMAQIQTLQAANAGDTTASAVSTTSPTAVYGQDAYYYNAGAQAFTIQSAAANGTITTTTYTALDSNGNTFAQEGGVGVGTLTFAGAASYAVSTTTASTTSTSAGSLLTQNATDLTGLGSATVITSSNATSLLTSVNNALAAVQNYSGYIGATQDRLTAASNFDSALTTDYSNGVSGLVDADMNTASTKLQALQTQEQLGIQSLSIANQNAQLILKLFQ